MGAGGGEEEGSGEEPRQEGCLLCSNVGQSTSCKPRGTHASVRRQVWTALCQQPKINKILSARNLLKHIHLAVLGKERREEGSREEASPRDTLEKRYPPSCPFFRV